MKDEKGESIGLVTSVDVPHLHVPVNANARTMLATWYDGNTGVYIRHSIIIHSGITAETCGVYQTANSGHKLDI